MIPSIRGYQLAFQIIFNWLFLYSNMLLKFNIKNSKPWSNKKDRTRADPALLDSMPLGNKEQRGRVFILDSMSIIKT